MVALSVPLVSPCLIFQPNNSPSWCSLERGTNSLLRLIGLLGCSIVGYDKRSLKLEACLRRRVVEFSTLSLAVDSHMHYVDLLLCQVVQKLIADIHLLD